MKMAAKLIVAWGLLALSATASGAAAEKPDAVPSGIVYLHRSTKWSLELESQSMSGLLSREIARQAFLIAARDQLGLSTRDYWLGDAMPGKGDNRPFDLSTASGQPARWQLRRENSSDCPSSR